MSPAKRSRAAGLGALLGVAGVSFIGLVPAAAPPASYDDPEPPAFQTFTNSVGMKFVKVRPGKFLMGAPRDEKGAPDEEMPQHEVEITREYHVGIYEVTQKQYKAVTGTNPSYFRKGGDGKDDVRGLDVSDFPVESVTWQNAQAFVRKLTALAAEKQAGVTYRLPTEAEWEYACRGGHLAQRWKEKAQLPFHFKKPSASLGSGQANFLADHPYGDGKAGRPLGRTCKVGSYQPNVLGIHDVHGNVWEWCSDWFSEEYYAKSPKKDPRGPAKGKERVCRGGGWDDKAVDCRTAMRYPAEPKTREEVIGFRVVAVRQGR